MKNNIIRGQWLGVEVGTVALIWKSAFFFVMGFSFRPLFLLAFLDNQVLAASLSMMLLLLSITSY